MFDFVKEKNSGSENVNMVIQNIESRYAIDMPDILKDYYRKHNGCKIQTVPFMVRGFECEVAKIVPVGPVSMSFEDIKNQEKEEGLLPDTFCPIARDRGGNYYYWDSATYEVFLVLSDDYEHPFKISDTVDQFFAIMDDALIKTN